MITARLAAPSTPANRSRSIDLDTFDPKLLPDPIKEAAIQAAARRNIIALGGGDLLEMLGLEPMTAGERV